MLFSKLAYGSAITMAVLPVVLTVPEFVAQTDSRFRPIVSSMEAVPVSYADGIYTISVTGEKHRECRPVSFSAFSVFGTILTEVPFQFVEDASPGSAKPVGTHDFGLWQFDLRDVPATSKVEVYSVHDCNAPWFVTSVMGPWPVEKVK